jgi:hypothetical protein
MKALRAVVLAALAAGGLATAADVSAADARGIARTSGSTTHHWSGTHRTAGSWSGHRWHGGYHHSHWRGGVGLYFGVPLFWPTYYWGYPYYWDGYPRTVIYREVERYPASYPEGEIAAPQSTEVPRGPGAPTQGPLYMNYCESAKAYYPKVTACPDGWRFIQPGQQPN